jgi:SH3 domain protein
MMIPCKKPVFLLLLLSFALMTYAVLPAGAETRYVSDRLIISMREGQSPGSPAVAFLVAGTPVEVIEEAENHLLVKIANGQQGWVRTKYIVTQLPKSMVIKDLNAQIKELEDQIKTMESQAGADSEDATDVRKIYEFKIKNLETLLENEKQSSAAMQKELKDVKTRNKQLQTEVGKLTEQNKGLSTKSDGSATLKKEIKSLQRANQELNQQIDQMKSADQSSMLSSAVKWFLAGGGVLLLGLILGRSVPKKNPYGY